MKKILAIILSIAMLFGVLALNTFAADETPTVEIVTNEKSPVDEGTEIYFAVKFNNFSSIKGMDVIITCSEGTFKSQTINADVVYNGNELKEGTNFKVDEEKNQIRVVNLNTNSDGTTNTTGVLAVKTIAGEENATITMTGEYADSGKTFFTINSNDINGVVAVIPEPNPTQVKDKTSLTATDGKFIPNGAVYKIVDGKFDYTYKTKDGVFTVNNDYFYNEYAKPTEDNAITTYGASDSTDGKAIRFGSYSELNTSDAVKHGTMVFEGDYVYFKNYYIKKGWTVEKFVKAFYDAYDSAKQTTPNADYIFFKIGDKQLNVYKFDQKNHMFKNGNVLEFTISLRDPDGKDLSGTYAAVAYSINAEQEATLSKEVKSVTKNPVANAE